MAQKSETTPKSAKKFQKASEKASQSTKSNAEVPTDDTNDVKERSEVLDVSTDDANAQDMTQDATEVKQTPPQSPQATSPTEIKRPKRSSSFHNMSTRLVLQWYPLHKTKLFMWPASLCCEYYSLSSIFSGNADVIVIRDHTPTRDHFMTAVRVVLRCKDRCLSAFSLSCFTSNFKWAW